MKNKARTDHHLFGGVTDVYLALMLSVFLLWPGTDGDHGSKISIVSDFDNRLLCNQRIAVSGTTRNAAD